MPLFRRRNKRKGLDQNKQPGGFGMGPKGECICPSCGKKVPHQRGIPCYEQKCPNCGKDMTRPR